MDKENGLEFKTRKLTLAYWAAIPLMFTALLIYIILKENVENRTILIVLYACMVIFFSANSIWLIKVPLISLKDNRLIISSLIFFRKVLPVDRICNLSQGYWYFLIRTSDSDSVRFPNNWLTRSERMQLEDLLLQIVQNNQSKADSLKPDP